MLGGGASIKGNTTSGLTPLNVAWGHRLAVNDRCLVDLLVHLSTDSPVHVNVITLGQLLLGCILEL